MVVATEEAVTGSGRLSRAGGACFALRWRKEPALQELLWMARWLCPPLLRRAGRGLLSKSAPQQQGGLASFHSGRPPPEPQRRKAQLPSRSGTGGPFLHKKEKSEAQLPAGHPCPTGDRPPRGFSRAGQPWLPPKRSANHLWSLNALLAEIKISPGHLSKPWRVPDSGSGLWHKQAGRTGGLTRCQSLLPGLSLWRVGLFCSQANADTIRVGSLGRTTGPSGSARTGASYQTGALARF